MTKIYFGKLEIGAIDDDSAVNYGKNVVISMDSHEKQNEAFGELSGARNVLGRGRYGVRDDDVIDLLLTQSSEARERLKQLRSTE